MKPIAVVGIVGGVLGAGTLAFFKFVKPRLQRTKENQNAITDTSAATSSGSALWGGLTSQQTTQLQTNLNATRQAFLVDEKAGNNSAEAKTFLATFTADLQVDGKYGDKTKAAVRALQTYLRDKEKANIKVDGYYGTETENAYEAWAKKSTNYATSKKILSGT